MIDLTKIIEGIEALAYALLMWILLIPKTLAKIVFHPAWAPGYVSEQLKEDARSRFDDYLSPILLILLCSLIPFVYAYTTPRPAVAISGPMQAEINKGVDFTATANFISRDGQYTYEWGHWDGATYTMDGTWDSSQTTDFLTFTWSTPGWKTIAVTASNDKGESYYYEYDIFVVDPSQPASAQGTTINTASPKSGEAKSWQSALEGMPGFLAALAFLSIPLLFSLAIEAFRGNPLTSSSLMRSFYVQCYFLSPFALAVWSFILGVEYFITPSEWLLYIFAAAVVLVMLLQLIRNEVLLIAAERRIHRGLAFWIILACLLVITLVALTIFFLSGNAEALRQSLGWFYIVFVIGLFLTGVWNGLFRRRPTKDI